MTSKKLIGSCSALTTSPAWIIEAFTFAAEHWQHVLFDGAGLAGFW